MKIKVVNKKVAQFELRVPLIYLNLLTHIKFDSMIYSFCPNDALVLNNCLLVLRT
jgi:hypothetical protein